MKKRRYGRTVVTAEVATVTGELYCNFLNNDIFRVC